MRDWDENNPWKPNKNFYNQGKCGYDQDDQGYSYDDYFCDDDNCGKKKHPDFDCRPDQELLFKIFKALCIIKKEIDKCDDILGNPKFGLKEIKREIRNIECAIFSPTFGLQEIKEEVSAIESAVFSDTFGLEEIKSEISTIETIVGGIQDTVVNPVFGLSEIKAEVSAIESAVFNETFGLLEIKSEVSQILANQDSPFLSTGPFLLECEEQVLHLKAVNKTGTPQSATFFVSDLSTCPPTQVGTFATGSITPCCAVFDEIDISGLGRRNIEINVTRSNQGVLVYAATLTGNLNCPGRKVSEIRHNEWAPVPSSCLT